MIASGDMLAQVDRVQVERRLEFAALPEGWAALAMIAAAGGLCWLVVWLYRREGRAGASLRMRMLMSGLRVVVVLMLMAIWLEPVMATYLHRLIDSYTLVLVDTSSSMDLQDRYRDADQLARVKRVAPDAGDRPARRIDLVEQVLTHDDNALLRRLTENNRVRIHGFSDSVAIAATLRAQREEEFQQIDEESEPDGDESLVSASDAGVMELRFEAQGPATNVGRAVRETVESLGRSPIAGVILLTDGGINRGDSAETIARYAADRKLPLHVVGVGDPSPPRNIRVAEVIAPDNVFAEDPFAVVAQIASQGMAGEQVDVELIERSAEGDGEGHVVETQSIVAGADNAIEAVTFQRRQNVVGRYVYRVNVPVAPSETVADDNAKQLTVNVIDNKLRVLLVSGAPSWDYRYLSRLLERDQTFELSCWLQSADIDAVRDGNVIIDHLPYTAEELFSYDALILLDADPLEFNLEWSQLVARLVSEQGGGLMVAAARLHTPGFMRDPAVEPLVRMLPVTPDPDADLMLNELGHYQQKASEIVVPGSAAGHPAMKLPGGDNAPDSWAGVGQVYWHFPVLREKPVATVLMRHGDPRMQNVYGPHVLLATQYVGSGRTAFLAFDSTWRWREHGDAVFNKFWVQMIRYLVEGKLAGGNRRGAILTESDSYQLGEAVTVHARLFDRAFSPLQVNDVTAEFRIGDSSGEFRLSPLADRPGWYEGRFVPPRTGSCELTLPIPESDSPDDVARREIQIIRPNLEIVDPRMNRSALVGMAELSDGGQYYEIDEAHRIPEAIPDRHESTTIRSRPTPLWDETWLLVALVVLLSAEWALRKYFRLL